MTRDAFADRLLDLAYGELPAREARAVEAHAASCDGCRAELARIRETRRLMAALPDEAPSDGGERILLAAARQAVEARAPRRVRATWLWGAAAAFSLVAVAAVSWRIAAMREDALERSDSEALLGGPYASPPPGGPTAPVAPATPDPSAREATAGGASHREVAPAPPPSARAPEARAIAKSAPAPSQALRERAEAADGPGVRAEEAERFAAAPEPSDAGGFAEPPAARAAAPEAAAAPQAKRAAPREAAPAPVASSAPRAALRASEAPTAEVRTFEGCEGEALRRVERDAEGRLVRYVREGRIAGRRLRIEHVYGPGGAIARAIARDLDSGALLDAGALGIELPARAAEAGIDAPPRCGR